MYESLKQSRDIKCICRLTSSARTWLVTSLVVLDVAAVGFTELLSPAGGAKRKERSLPVLLKLELLLKEKNCALVFKQSSNLLLSLSRRDWKAD